MHKSTRISWLGWADSAFFVGAVRDAGKINMSFRLHCVFFGMRRVFAHLVVDCQQGDDFQV